MSVKNIVEELDLYNLNKEAILDRLSEKMKTLYIQRQQYLEKLPYELQAEINNVENMNVVIGSATRPNTMTDSDLQELRPILKSLVENGDMEKYKFSFLYKTDSVE